MVNSFPAEGTAQMSDRSENISTTIWNKLDVLIRIK